MRSGGEVDSSGDVKSDHGSIPTGDAGEVHHESLAVTIRYRHSYMIPPPGHGNPPRDVLSDLNWIQNPVLVQVCSPHYRHAVVRHTHLHENTLAIGIRSGDSYLSYDVESGQEV